MLFERCGDEVILLRLGTFQEQPHGSLPAGQAAGQFLAERRIDRGGDHLPAQRAGPGRFGNSQRRRILNREPRKRRIPDCFKECEVGGAPPRIHIFVCQINYSYCQIRQRLVLLLLQQA